MKNLLEPISMSIYRRHKDIGRVVMSAFSEIGFAPGARFTDRAGMQFEATEVLVLSGRPFIEARRVLKNGNLGRRRHRFEHINSLTFEKADRGDS